MPRILIVDDNPPFRHLLRAFLTKASCNVVEAENGLQALEKIPVEHPDLILLDLQMQPLGGFEFMREFTASGNTTPVVLITGDESTDILNHATKLGFVGVLKKPVTEARVLQIVERFAKRG